MPRSSPVLSPGTCRDTYFSPREPRRGPVDGSDADLPALGATAGRVRIKNHLHSRKTIPCSYHRPLPVKAKKIVIDSVLADCWGYIQPF
jgi:hypothetical protein